MDAGQLRNVALVARSKEKKVTTQLKQSQQDFNNKSDQLNQLIHFKEEYEHLLEEMSGKGMAARQLQDYRAFLSKLNSAIARQNQEIETSGQNLDAAKGKWVDNARYQSSLDSLLESCRKARINITNKEEQKYVDERSATLHHQKQYIA